MEIQVPTSWQSLLAFFVTTGLFSLVWAAAIDLVKSLSTRSTEAKYIAARTAVALEAYSIECWHRIQMAEGHYYMTREANILELPEQPTLPTDVNWRAMPPTITAKVLSFLNDAAIEENAARYSRTFEGNPFDFETATRKQGKAAWALALELRRKYGLPILDAQRERLSDLHKK